MSIRQLFNDGWEFSLVTPETPEAISALPTEGWQPVDIPHDWLIRDTGALYADGDGWYRKRFRLDAPGAYTALRFDGVYMDCTVFVNGQTAGEWKYGYTSFELDISALVRRGENQVAVRCVYRSPNTRWYSGAGVYRSVWLVTAGAERIVSDGVYLSTAPGEGGYTLTVETETTAESPDLRHSLLDPDGGLVCQLRGGAAQSAFLAAPKEWSPWSPELYTLVTELLDGDRAADRTETRFGFRQITLDPDRGFFINGRQMKLHGVCMHHDLGCLGAAFHLPALRRQFRSLFDMGVNAIRTSHNPPAPELLALADEMGMLVIDEAFDMWERYKTPKDYARFFPQWWRRDVASWVRRDRNHPCVILWSIGNEISDTASEGRGLELTKLLRDEVRLHDPHKNAGVTIGSNYMPWESAQKCADELDAAGYNYAESHYAAHHAAHPARVIYGSETMSTVQSRGVYHFPAARPLLTDDDLQCSSLGNSRTSWGALSAEYAIYMDRNAPFSLGQFIWTGWDYIGEPTPYHTKNSYFGQVDTAGFEKDNFYLFKAEWAGDRAAPFVHLFPYWDFNPDQLIDIGVTTNCPQAELFFNGHSLGRRRIDHAGGEALLLRWQLSYAPGTLEAFAYDDQGRALARDQVRSFGDAASIALRPDKTVLKADGQDLCFVEISTRDAQGTPVANDRSRVQVSVRGAGRLLGLDNGDSTDFEQYQCDSRRLFSGKLLAVVAATTEPGEITVQVTSPGLPEAALCLRAEAAPAPAGISAMESVPKHSPIYEIPVRKITITPQNGRSLSPDCPVLEARCALSPQNATYPEVEWRACNQDGIPSRLVRLEPEGHSVRIYPLGDGPFQLRCLTRNGGEHPALYSMLEYTVSGFGAPLLDGFDFLAGGLYSRASAGVGNGNEHGFASSREGDSWAVFDKVDLGDGAEGITLSVFELEGQPLTIELWDGEPHAPGSRLISLLDYHKPSLWNRYQPESWRLPEPLRGVHTIGLLLHRKAHIGGLVFTRPDRAFQPYRAGDCARVYGDAFTPVDGDITGIGNNVTVEFHGLEFGDGGAACICLTGRSPLPESPIQLRFSDGRTEMLSFRGTDEYTQQRFPLSPPVLGRQDLSFVFLPGSRFDFRSFRFEQ